MFITNHSNENINLGQRIRRLIEASDELKFLVGFFYFSGWQEVVESLRNNPQAKLKILVGLQVDSVAGYLVEFAGQGRSASKEQNREIFFRSLQYALNDPANDQASFQEDLRFFMDMLESGRLEIRKTLNPNHAKLYLFKHKHDQVSSQSFITGSSNLTRRGLHEQDEFNVEIRDHGYREAEVYFDELWDTAIPIRPEDIVNVIKTRTQWAEISPFEAYVYVLKTYLETRYSAYEDHSLEGLLQRAGFRTYRYQIDAVNQARKILDDYDGVIIADVVGLGKSVIASLLARSMNRRGLILAPPGLMGDELAHTGWYEYIEKFGLYDWKIFSTGKLKDLAEQLAESPLEYDVVIVDEAHRFRNEDTESYNALSQITKGKKVILLTATPFNNSPSDVFALLKLFIVPGKSPLTISENLQMEFEEINNRFKILSTILKYAKSKEKEKKDEAHRLYVKYIASVTSPDIAIEIKRVRAEMHALAQKIREFIKPVLIRRNRIDLMQDPEYSKEINDLPRVKDPVSLFFELTPKQSEFYDRVIDQYFAEGGLFTGAIYKPDDYVNSAGYQVEKIDHETEWVRQRQYNLYDFMRRLLVKRFESSFGAFHQSIRNFLNIHRMILQFVRQSGKYFLARDLIERAYSEGDDENEAGFTEEKIQKAIEQFLERGKTSERPRDKIIYDLKQMEQKDKFLSDIQNDIALFEKILAEMEALDLLANDPKRQKTIETLKEVVENPHEHPRRKVVLFTEYADTVKYLKPYFEEKFGKRVLFCDGNLDKTLSKDINANFNAQYPAERQEDNYDILLTTDKLAEGVNLNRAGLVVNYDIPWNPTRVIQRVGRINRIGTKVFDELWIYNFFPTERGADINRSKEIAIQKMTLIHKALGEDVKIFDPDEEPQASGLFEKLNPNPDKLGQEDISTKLRREMEEIREKYPDLVEKVHKFPQRLKTAKPAPENEPARMVLAKRKGLNMLFVSSNGEETGIISTEEAINGLKCSPDTPRLPASKNFWELYDQTRHFKPRSNRPATSPFVSKTIGSLEELYRWLNQTPGEKLSGQIRDVPALRRFITNLLEDLRTYLTLPKYTQRILQRKENEPMENFAQRVEKLRNIMGTDYLDKIKERASRIEEEIIVAVENQKP